MMFQLSILLDGSPLILLKLWMRIFSPTQFCQSTSNTSKIGFNSTSRLFLIAFQSIMPTSNMSSFIRQLNLYGFRKLTDPDGQSNGLVDVLEFTHDQFRNDRPELRSAIKRKQAEKVPVQGMLKVGYVYLLASADVDKVRSELSELKQSQEAMVQALQRISAENEQLVEECMCFFQVISVWC